MPLSTSQTIYPTSSYAAPDYKLNLFWLSEDHSGRLMLLGCPLELTPREYGVLMSIIRHYPGTAPVETICRDCEGLGACSVPVHINAINKKSARIGGRRLVIAQRGLGYILNRYM